MTNEHAEETAQLAAAVKPGFAEVSDAEQVVLAQVKHGAIANIRDCVVALCEHWGVSTSDIDERNLPFALYGPDRYEGLAERTRVRQLRATAAVRTAVSRLLAQGSLVPMDAWQDQEDLHLPVTLGHNGPHLNTALHIPTDCRRMPGRFRITPGLEAIGDVPLLRAAQWQSEIGPLLTPRSAEVLEEALTALRRGLYMSAVSQFGAVNEAAWHVVAHSIINRGTPPARVQSLTNILQHRGIAALQNEVLQQLEADGVKTYVAVDLRAFATYLRDLRNYGVHPTILAQPAPEHAFTSLGCLSVAQQTHHHLAQLIDAAAVAGISL
ncbi:hypothetical protein [Nocardia sp. R7R-8]|uniref:hypothetical protein n=1 Tax=Nocardia sp. R7R-8 TaxID=3459304 RepID=UPI00403E2C50